MLTILKSALHILAGMKDRAREARDAQIIFWDFEKAIQILTRNGVVRISSMETATKNWTPMSKRFLDALSLNALPVHC